jgi:hypothetical protein
MPGTATSTAEVTNISQHGFWMLIDGRELFLAFDEFRGSSTRQSRRFFDLNGRRRSISTGPT